MKKLLLITILTLGTSQAFAASNYIELCTGDKYLAKEFGDGNPAGHALIYVNGLCKDYDQEFPQVKICDSTDNHKGVGISLDAAFQNVKWTAVPTRELALFGDYGQGRVDRAVVQKIMSKVKEYRVFENVQFDESVFPQAVIDYTSDKIDQYTLYSMGTGVAFNTARNMNCIKTKVGLKQMNNLSFFLNKLNSSYYHSDSTYVWSISDNCTHLSINSLASAGIGKVRKTKTRRNLVSRILNLTLPKSEFLKTVRRVNRAKFSPRYIWRNKKYRAFFLEYGRLPWSHGNLVAKYEIIKNNDFFHTTGGSLMALPTIGMSLKKAFRKENSELSANLSKYRTAITKALNSSYFKKTSKDEDKNNFLVTYKKYLDGQLLDINK